MKMSLRAFALALPVLALTWPVAAPAQEFPTKPIKIVVPFGAGGPADVYSRQLGQHLTEALKQPVVI